MSEQHEAGFVATAIHAHLGRATEELREALSSRTLKPADLRAIENGHREWVGTGVGTPRAFPALLSQMTRAILRKPPDYVTSNGPGRDRTSARGFEVRRSIH
jgi:hypothetical protein